MMHTLTTVAPLQTIPASGGGASTLSIIVVLGVALYAIDEWVVDLTRFLPSLGGQSKSGSGGGLLGMLPDLNGLLLGVVGLALAFVLAGFGPAGSTVPLVVALNLLAAYLLLREFDAYDPVLFAIVSASTVVIALSALGEPVIGTVVNSDVGPILVIGGLYLTWKAIQAYRDSNKRPPIVVRRGGGR